jgi:hypothetical protein
MPPHSAKRRLQRLPDRRIRLLVRFFFRLLDKMSQSAFDAATVYAHTEPLAHEDDQVLQAQCGVLGAHPHQLRDDLVGKLVGAVWATFAGQEARHAALGEGFASLIKGRARETKSRGCARDRHTIDPDLPQHFVLDLQQIVGIEEDAALKERIGDVLGVRMQGAAHPQKFSFACS